MKDESLIIDVCVRKATSMAVILPRVPIARKPPITFGIFQAKSTAGWAISISSEIIQDLIFRWVSLSECVHVLEFLVKSQYITASTFKLTTINIIYGFTYAIFLYSFSNLCESAHGVIRWHRI